MVRQMRAAPAKAGAGAHPPGDLAEEVEPGVLDPLCVAPPRREARRTMAEAAGGLADLAHPRRLDRVAAHGLELGADQPGAVGPAELLAEEAELGGAVAMAGGGVLGVGETATAALLEAEAELDVLGSGHVRVEVADALEDVAAGRRRWP